MSFAKKQCANNKLQQYAEYALIAGGIAFLAMAMDGSVKFGDAKGNGLLGFLDSNKELRRIAMAVFGLAGLYKLSCEFFYESAELKKKGEACAADCECESTDCDSTTNKCK